jgi:hypothetical protein
MIFAALVISLSPVSVVFALHAQLYTLYRRSQIQYTLKPGEPYHLPETSDNKAMNAEFACRSVFVDRLVLANSFVSHNSILTIYANRLIAGVITAQIPADVRRQSRSKLHRLGCTDP